MITSARSKDPAAPTWPRSLPWTGDEEADRLLAEDANALLIGFVLDQQVTVQKAFSGPLELRRRVGTIDPRELAAMPAERPSPFCSARMWSAVASMKRCTRAW